MIFPLAVIYARSVSPLVRSRCRTMHRRLNKDTDEPSVPMRVQSSLPKVLAPKQTHWGLAAVPNISIIEFLDFLHFTLQILSLIQRKLWRYWSLKNLIEVQPDGEVRVNRPTVGFKQRPYDGRPLCWSYSRFNVGLNGWAYKTNDWQIVSKGTFCGHPVIAWMLWSHLQKTKTMMRPRTFRALDVWQRPVGTGSRSQRNISPVGFGRLLFQSSDQILYLIYRWFSAERVCESKLHPRVLLKYMDQCLWPSLAT